MNSSQPHHHSVADEQAALWAARLDGDSLDRAQRAELDAWLAQNPAHRALLSQYCQFSADLEERLPALVAAGGVSMPAPAPSPRRRRWTFPRLASLTLAAATAVTVTFIVMRPAPPVENVSTSPGQRSTQTLADGTRVELNANTSLRFENSKTERRVRLAGGEALFMVTKDATRPFFVETPAGSVRVTGTQFNVRTAAAATTFEVTVIEGSVQVRAAAPDPAAGAAPIMLGAGDQFSATSAGGTKHALSADELDDALAWRQGQIVFRDVPLREAVARFAQYHGRAINVDPAVASETIGGRHSLEDLSGFLAGLEVALSVKVNYDLAGAVTVSARR